MSADFQNIADYYDAMYVDPKEYEQEAEKTAQIIEYYSKSDNPRILDIACGTGEQSLYLAKHYQVTGIDLSREMLDKAREKVPDVEFLEKDMLDFKLEHRYRAAVNLYGSIGFAENLQRMEAGIRCAWDCLEEGGVLILTPWGTRETFSEGSIADCRQRNGVNFCRMETVKRAAEDRVQVEMFHLIGRGLDVRQFHHVQNITLFSEAEYRSALEKAGFTIRARLSEQEFRMGAFVCTK
ncbi:MAG: methyltransferase domain-containing protein [Enterocloster asparagiformis]|nr:methyltransferase domain-containing protein [Enterocloster asparagiformis]